MAGSELADYAHAEVQKIVRTRWRRIRVALNVALCERALGVADVAVRKSLLTVNVAKHGEGMSKPTLVRTSEGGDGDDALERAFESSLTPSHSQQSLRSVLKETKSHYVPKELYGGGGDMLLVDPDAEYDVLPGDDLPAEVVRDCDAKAVLAEELEQASSGKHLTFGSRASSVDKLPGLDDPARDPAPAAAA